MKTLKELTNIYGLSRVTFLKRMNKIANFRKKYTKRSKGKIFINNEGVKLINEPRHNSTSNQFHTRHGSSPNQLNRAELIKLWKQARNDSRKKDKVISRLSKSFESLSQQQHNHQAQIMNTHHQHKLPPGQSYGYDQAVKINDQAKELRAKNKSIKSINKTLNKVKHLSLLQLLRMWLKNY